MDRMAHATEGGQHQEDRVSRSDSRWVEQPVNVFASRQARLSQAPAMGCQSGSATLESPGQAFDHHSAIERFVQKGDSSVPQCDFTDPVFGEGRNEYDRGAASPIG